MACMFNKYFELASNNHTGESLAFIVAEIAFLSGCDDFLSACGCGCGHFFSSEDHFCSG